ncbi:hypothetical protein BH10ACI1_BH10ACI1_26590 [soil metagenome]
MMNDSVREELKDKISPILMPKAIEKKEFFNIPNRIEPQMLNAQVNPPVVVSAPKISVERTVERLATAEIAAKQTAPTLVEFHSKNATLPEWRLQLQNAVRKRQGINSPQSNGVVLTTNGSNALKIQPDYVPEINPAPAAETVIHANPTLNSALQRIADARRAYLTEEPTETATIVAETTAPAKTFPYRIAAKGGEIMSEAKPATANYTVKPRTPVTLKTEVKKFDTNKLPPVSAEVSEAFDIHKTTPTEITNDVEAYELKLVETAKVLGENDVETEEIDDLAPFSMRFNAGLFDLIIGSFATLIMLAPFMMKGGWFSFSGFLGFLAICAVVMFVYMTVAIGFYGRTLGMRFFALEVVDIEGENYPTIHQAAVSSSLYLLSMLFGGAGFLTLPFNDEKRAVHDLASGTIVVKEI